MTRVFSLLVEMTTSTNEFTKCPAGQVAKYKLNNNNKKKNLQIVRSSMDRWTFMQDTFFSRIVLSMFFFPIAQSTEYK